MHHRNLFRILCCRCFLILFPYLQLFAQEKNVACADKIRYHFYRSEYDSVIYYYSDEFLAFSHQDSAAACLNFVARCYYYLGQNKMSMDLYRKILANPPHDPAIRSRLHINYSEVLIETTQYSEAEAQLDISDGLLNGLDQPALLALNLNMRGVLSMRMSDNAKAFTYFERALISARRSEDVRRVSLILTNMATLHYYSGHYQEALKIYEEVLKIDLAGKNLKDLAVDYGNIGNTYLQLNDRSKSLEYFLLSKEAYTAVGDSAGLSLVLGNISLVYIGEEEYAKAGTNLREALRIAVSIGDRLGEAEWNFALALVNYKSGDFVSAEEGFQKVADQYKTLKSTANYGLTLIEAGKCRQKLNDRIGAINLFYTASDVLKSEEGRHELWRAQYQLAKIFASEENADRADSLFLASIKRIEESRTDLSSELTTYFIEDERLEVYRTYVNFLLTRDRPSEAFDYFEKSKARNLLDLLSSGKEMEVAATKDNSWIIEYFLHPDGSYAFVISPDRVTAIPIGGRDMTNKFVKEYLALIKRPKKNTEASIQLSHRLYQAVWEPIEQKVSLPSRLTIIPDESLYYLPFESLSDGREFLVERYEFVYAPSAMISRALEYRSKNSERNGRIAVLSRSRYPEHKQKRLKEPDLSYVQSETVYIRDLFDGRAMVFMDESLTKRVLSDSAMFRSSIVHFAAHGINDIDKPSQSSILLCEPDSASDGSFTVGEIQNLNFENKLIVLSACETSLGRLLTGEGMLGLTRAFMAAGASSIVSTLWNVYDESTSEFMRMFYGVLVNQNISAAGALREAKRKMIRSGKWNDPAYWAPFVIWGAEF